MQVDAALEQIYPPRRGPQRSANTFHTEALARKWLADSLAKVPAEHQAAAESAVRAFPNRLQAETFATQFLRSK